MSSSQKYSQECSVDPCTYTTGHWLHNDQLQHQCRYIKFDFDALCGRVLEVCPSEGSISSYEKNEGGYNKVFIFTLESGRKVVARLPMPISGPLRLRTNSEVATIKYVQSTTSVPIPRILDWSDDSTHGIGSEYIIMEHANGVQLHQNWPNMDRIQHFRCVAAIGQHVKETAAIEIPAYGSLYFDDVDMDAALKRPFVPGYIIGPSCQPTYWDCDIREPRYYSVKSPRRGPWSDISTYCSALVDVGLSRLPPIQGLKRPAYFGSLEDHRYLLHAGKAVAAELAKNERIQRGGMPILLHPDLHKRNIFVSESDPTTITGIIDWQACSISPAIMFADQIPDFATLPKEPDEDDEPKTRDEQMAYDDAVDCNTAWRATLELVVPKLKRARQLDMSILRFFEACHRTYKDGAGVFRQVLIDLHHQWTDLGMPGECPYQLPTGEKLLAHEEDYKALSKAQEFRSFIATALNADYEGWVPTEAWKQTCISHKELFAELRKTMDEEQVVEIWPFDHPDSLLQDEKVEL